jgi:hypothetical protein
LTSWTGAISGYRRSENHTWLQVSTDYDTLEQTTIEHEGHLDSTAHYLLWGKHFTENDWTLIENSAGALIEGMRATVWVCGGGVTPPVVDWQPPPK